MHVVTSRWRCVRLHGDAFNSSMNRKPSAAFGEMNDSHICLGVIPLTCTYMRDNGRSPDADGGENTLVKLSPEELPENRARGRLARAQRLEMTNRMGVSTGEAGSGPWPSYAVGRTIRGFAR